MLTDLTHNKIISDTVTDKFIASAESVLVPLITDAYGEGAIVIQMYEDHLADGFLREGRWFYPFTVLTDKGTTVAWVSWSVDKKRFRSAVPYAFVGDGQIDFTLHAEVPEEFNLALEGRNIYAPSDYIKIKLHTASDDPLFLSGKYSQTFVDEMARQLTERIASQMQVSGLESSNLTLQMIFAPETYMEHTSENVTYRRLRLADKTGAPRDFWIKWVRTDSRGAYSVSDTPILGTVRFDIAEDVPLKVKEKEYRFLLAADADKYQSAMSRKTVTEWRELIKRALKRGELEKEALEPIDEPANGSEDKLNELLASLASPPPPVEETDTEKGDSNDPLEQMLRRLLAESGRDVAETADGASDSDELAPIEVAPEEEAVEDTAAEELDSSEPAIDDEDDVPFDLAESVTEKAVSEPKVVVIESIDEPEFTEPVITDAERERQLREEIEAKIRLEYENMARIKAEEEAKQLAIEQERLRRENERLLEEARKQQELRIKQEAEQAEREAKLKAQIEAQMREEAREKERLAEAAMLAIEQKRRMEREAEEARLKEAERLAMEARLREEEARRIEAERQRREEEERIARERAEAERARAEAEAEKEREAKRGYTFTSKRVTFIFRNNIDPAIIGAMESIVRATITEEGKTGVPINIKASVIDERSVCLDFVKIPVEEEQLLINIVQALGKGNLGIAKARVD